MSDFSLFIDPEKINADIIKVEGEDFHYLKNVLRVAVGTEGELRDGSNKFYQVSVRDLKEKSLTLKIERTTEEDTELPVKITLAQALPKSDKMELIIQKSVELGVQEIIPLQTEHCVVKLTKDKAPNKVERWQKIAKAAALQSGRNIVPQIASVTAWQDLLNSFKNYDLVLLPWELENQTSLKTILQKGDFPGSRLSCLVIIGPEGGFSQNEIASAKEAGAKTITLGKRILRTETAGMAILAMLNYIYQ